VAVEPRRYTRLIGLMVEDAPSYSEYRRHMLPLLHQRGGAFGLDLEVSRVLLAPEPGPMNRVFTLTFPSRQACDELFADPAYLAVRDLHFEPAVSRVLQLAHWED
jgi:uncharacterized protein (DUF1330 family)